MRVGADHGIRVGHPSFLAEDHAGEVFDVDLMNNAGIRRHNLEVVECGLAPAQEGVAFLVAVELDLGIEIQSIVAAGFVDHHGVVDHQLNRYQRVDLGRIATQLGHRITHRGQIDHAGHTGEILQNHAGRSERDFRAGFCLGIPVDQGVDVVLGDVDAIFVAHQVLQQHLQGVGQTVELSLRGHRAETVVIVRRAANRELAASTEAIGHEQISLF